ncbi:MAG TPA: DUF72 domain-containing protein [Candidatus Nitrosocosmicus sp.]|nr:DUF72 domain-containing protein [Candidatus Nitrosocosmicus sp.]
MAINIGCSGWSCEGWKGNFYPKNMDTKDYLSYYSKFFKFVELDSTYYHIPSRSTVRGWKDKTPPDFRFSLKFPRVITHEKKLYDVAKPLSIFFYSLEPLVGKTLTLLIQLLSFLTEKKGFDAIQDMVYHLDKRFRYSLEVRHSSWFTNDVYDFLKKNNISLVWSVRDQLTSPTIVTSDQIYIRFIGDRSISEMHFGKIVKDRRKEMLKYVKKVKESQDENSNNRDMLIAFNNHFAGFGPHSVNDFIKLMNMSEIDWKAELKSYENNSGQPIDRFQSSLSDFTK